MSPAPRRPRHASLIALIATSFLSAILVFAIAAVSLPGDALGANSTKVAKCSANLRTSASTSARARKVISTGTKVVANAKVTGGSWRTTCAGKAVSGKTWYRILSVNGKSVKSLYGVTYLYAAFRTVQGLRSPGVHALRRLSGERADGSRLLDDGESSPPDRHQGACRDAGQRDVVFDHVLRARLSQAVPGTGSPA